MAEKPTNIPPIHSPTAVSVAPTSSSKSPKKGAVPAHCQPCPPTINLDSPLRWKAANALEQKLLRSLQGNILKGHGRDRTWNIFFEFGADVLKSKRVLRELGNFFVTDAYTQLLETEAFKTSGTPGGTFCAAFLSAAGYDALGLTFTAPPGNSAFGPGMKDIHGTAEIADPEVSAWEDKFQMPLHGLILIGDDDIARGETVVEKVKVLLTEAGATVHHVQDGKAIRNTVGNGLEHFGYIDGRSQPLMLVEDIEKESRDEGISHWDPTFPLTTALVSDPLGNDPDQLSFGSFFVFRKLEQNVKEFKKREQELADQIIPAGGDRELAGALIVGRFEDGTPVTLSKAAKGAKEPRNDFDYSGDAAASRCPFHAHIRKTNPRGSGGFELEPAERLHIMARRGITYADLPRVHPNDLPEADSMAEFLDKVAPLLPSGGVGLLFMAYNAKLDDQFVFTQKNWANSDGFPRDPNATTPPAKIGLDPVIGQGCAGATQAHPNEWDNRTAGTTPFEFKGFVHMKGGEYFFAPSLRFLRNL
jgi:Dyp-type peroxidase family